MRYGSLPSSISRSLASDLIEPRHAPDGLTEQAIDDLLDELCPVVPSAPTHQLPARADDPRSEQRSIRLAARALPVTRADREVA